MSSNDLHYARITDIAVLLEHRELSPVELTQHILNRISALDNQLHGYQTVMAEQAMEAAAKAESEIVSGNYRGALLPLLVCVLRPWVRIRADPFVSPQWPMAWWVSNPRMEG